MKTKTISTLLPLGFATVTSTLMLGCASASIEPIGSIGPNHLKVYSISKSNFLNSSQMLVILDRKGDVSAYAGGTSSGFGTVGLQTGTALAAAGATVYGATAIKNGLQNASIRMKGIPENINVNANGTVGLSKETIDAIKNR